MNKDLVLIEDTKKYWIVVKHSVGPTEWTEENIAQSHPVAVFEEPRLLREWMKAKLKELKDGEMPPYSVYGIKWVDGELNAKTTHYLEGLPQDQDKYT